MSSEILRIAATCFCEKGINPREGIGTFFVHNGGGYIRMYGEKGINPREGIGTMLAHVSDET